MQSLDEALDNLTSPTLILALQEGGDTGNVWPRLVRIYAPLIYRWCQRSGVQEADASDISQEVMSDVIRAISEYSHDGDAATFRGWLWTITRNRIALHFRKWAKSPVAPGGTDALQLIEQVPDERPEKPEDVTDLHLRALETLKIDFNEATWTAFWRVVIDRDEAKDVAEDLGVSVWTVYKAKSRVLAKLRSELGGV
ncbi:MAG: sigma-70 family RNA polymerase sigma factor [Planctomycetota bacterium]